MDNVVSLLHWTNQIYAENGLQPYVLDPRAQDTLHAWSIDDPLLFRYKDDIIFSSGHTLHGRLPLVASIPLSDIAKIDPDDTMDRWRMKALRRRHELWKRVLRCSAESGLMKQLFDYSGQGQTYDLVPASLPAVGDVDRLRRLYWPCEVPLQLSYHGKGAIPNSLADLNCQSLGLHGILQILNNTLGTRYTLDTLGLHHCLQHYVNRRYDFGLVYGILRPRWPLDPSSSRTAFISIPTEIEARQKEDFGLRQAAIRDGFISNPRLPPRRV